MTTYNIDVPQLVRAERQDRIADRVLETRLMYKPKLDGTDDKHKSADLRLAIGIGAELQRLYPGYSWRVTCDSFQGIVYFSVPALMGDTLNAIIRLADLDRDPKLVMRLGGQLLERMRLPRRGFEAMSFCEARASKHTFDFADVGRRRIY